MNLLQSKLRNRLFWNLFIYWKLRFQPNFSYTIKKGNPFEVIFKGYRFHFRLNLISPSNICILLMPPVLEKSFRSLYWMVTDCILCENRLE